MYTQPQTSNREQGYTEQKTKIPAGSLGNRDDFPGNVTKGPFPKLRHPAMDKQEVAF